MSRRFSVETAFQSAVLAGFAWPGQAARTLAE